jgi:hypothetical protein
MISGPSGTGKTFSALRLAKGMAGPDGKIFVADTDNARARLYASAFDFMHLDLREPFRPMLFEQAAIAAQKQKAAVLIIDNFAAEWVGPGGVLEWADEELNRMAGDNLLRRESLKMVVWAKVKPPHKHMFQRLYQLNMAIILCCSAEKKIAMIKQTEGKDKGKVIPVDQGFQPIGDKDAAYAMTASLLLADVHNPGVPMAIKALLPDLKPIIHLDRPLDEATGAALAAWARGEKEPAAPGGIQAGSKDEEVKSQPPLSQIPLDSGKLDEPPPAVDDIPPADDVPPPPEDQRQDDAPSPSPPPSNKEADIEEGAKQIGAKFLNTADRRAHLALVDDPDLRKQIEWLKKHRKALYDREVGPAIKASWQRTDTQKPENKQGDLIR